MISTEVKQEIIEAMIFKSSRTMVIFTRLMSILNELTVGKVIAHEHCAFLKKKREEVDERSFNMIKRPSEIAVMASGINYMFTGIRNRTKRA